MSIKITMLVHERLPLVASLFKILFLTNRRVLLIDYSWLENHHTLLNTQNSGISYMRDDPVFQKELLNLEKATFRLNRNNMLHGMMQ